MPLYDLPGKALPSGPKELQFSLKPSAVNQTKAEVKQLATSLNPDVAPRMRGVVEKCTFCHHRLMAAKERSYAEGKHDIPESYYQTACTQACPSGAIAFGDLNNPDHKVHQLLQARKKDAFRLLEKLGTEPKVYYLTTRAWVRKKADNALDEPKGTGY